ncbi:MAG TPA: DNA mismatch repair endonuclease MutL, partial [Methanocorpusculum sp.]|nr:DNA mismatch repair endonuclease MutL [Methanocorpusculum sp.]
MNKIHLLDEETVSHIAAGEVVERAASIVKELVENSIDAGADNIKIDISSDGSEITKINVTDNGSGLSFDDALTAFRQHSTSKIKSHDDLEDISTLGFRGEALASIAAVSNITMITKEADSDSPEAAKVVISGGRLISHTQVGAPVGTNITVKDIFFNTPARKKFQKKAATELSRIYDIVERMALVHRKTAFILNYMGKERFRTFGNDDFAEVIACVFGTGFVKELTEIKHSSKIAEVHGYITKSGGSMRSTQSRFYLSVNSRQIYSKTLQWAVREGYGTLLPKGMYPAAFLDICVDPRNVDVNVHPTKKEVRISKEREVMRAVQDAVYCALHNESLFESGGIKDSEKSMQCGKSDAYSKSENSKLDDFVRESVLRYETGTSPSSARLTEKRLRRTEDRILSEAFEQINDDIPEILGQAAGTYIIAKNSSGDLLIIDQHAAHERIMYDKLKKRCGTDGQELINPVELHLTMKEAAAMPDMIDILKEAGYIIEPFGKDIWIVRSVPIVSSVLGNPEVIHQIISETIDEDPHNRESSLDRVLKTAACKAVVKGSTELNTEQMKRILRQLMASDSPYTCPHGRPTVIVLSKSKLDS